MNSGVQSIRERLLELPDFFAASADESPNLDQMYAPSGHAGALDPERSLVIGGRGVGKSFWSSVLHDEQARKAADNDYPRLNLGSLYVALGFHENVKGSITVAPTRAALSSAVENTDPVDIWRSVLLRALVDSGLITRHEKNFEETLKFSKEAPDKLDDFLIEADEVLASSNRRFLLVFDALDRLSNDWAKITKLSQGIAQLALDLRGYKAIRAKIFMRRDQYQNGEVFQFRDASKLVSGRVELFWAKTDLFGWLFQWLWRGDVKKFKEIVAKTLNTSSSSNSMPYVLTHDEEKQRAVFSELAGPYMGKNRRRGMTDRKVVNSIADAFGEASLRSFSAAIKTAAVDSERRSVSARALDHLALNEGIAKASGIRVEELKEDHSWIERALEPLKGLTVPCEQSEFEKRWKAANTIEEIQRLEGEKSPDTPISFTRGANTKTLIDALKDIGVVEIRKDSRINVPDLFRVAAEMGRKGGVKSARTRN